MKVRAFIPWADDGSAERRHALAIVQGFYDDCFPEWRCELAVTDTLFPRAQACNRAALASDADVLVFNDADSIVDPAQLEDAAELAGRGRFVRAYDVYRRLSQEASAACRDWEDVLAGGDVIWEQRETASHGVYAVPRDEFLELGGYDPRFRYFYDDCCLDLRLTEARLGQVRVEGPLYHLWHQAREPDPADEELWRRYQADSPAAVRAEIGWTAE